MRPLLRLVPIVEGQGEEAAVPLLLRRIASNIAPGTTFEVIRPVRTSRSKVVKEGELEQAAEFAVRKAGPQGAILLLLDADDDCPASLAPRLLERLRAVRPNLECAVVLAKFEFEAWFLAAAKSLAGLRGFPADLQAPPEPESIRGAKAWLEDRNAEGRYSPVADQPALASLMDLLEARRAASFDKLWREMERLLAG